jgi:hypothetical protein
MAPPGAIVRPALATLAAGLCSFQECEFLPFADAGRAERASHFAATCRPSALGRPATVTVLGPQRAFSRPR